MKNNPICRSVSGLHFALIVGCSIIGGFLLSELLNRSSVSKEFVSKWHFPTVVNDAYRHANESIIADELFNRLRIVCMIMTMPKHHETRAKAVKDTWAPKCNAYFFISSVVDSSLPSVAAVKDESRSALWQKTQYAIHYAAAHYGDYEYFLKADDDTYMIMENLRKLLDDHDPNKAFMMGRRFLQYVKEGFLSGGAGFVMSREALSRVQKGILNDSRCRAKEMTFADDLIVSGYCAEALNITILNSLDRTGHETFHPFGLGYMMSESTLNATTWFLSFNYHKIVTGIECCSDYAVSFHYITPEEMYQYHYFVYHLHAYGIHRDFSDMVKYLSLNSK